MCLPSADICAYRGLLQENPSVSSNIDYLQAACKNDPSSDEAKRAIDLLYDTALISSGYTVSQSNLLTFFVVSQQTVNPYPLYLLFSHQPDSAAELGSKIYQMMAIALGGRWGRLESEAAAAAEAEVSTEAGSGETTEAEVVEPSEVRTESDPWRD